MTIFEWHIDLYNSASAVGPDPIKLRALNIGYNQYGMKPCQVGAVGTYTFGLSSDGRTLTLTPVSDACAERAHPAGDWTRTHIGDLAPGHHMAAYVAPFGDDAGGTFSYTVPRGLGCDLTWPSPSPYFRGRTPTNKPTSAYGRMCPRSLDRPAQLVQPGAPRTPAAIAAWLADSRVSW